MLVKTSKDKRKGLRFSMSNMTLAFNEEGIAEVDDQFREAVEGMSGRPYFLEIVEEEVEPIKEETEKDYSKMTVTELVKIAKEIEVEWKKPNGSKPLKKEEIIANIKNK